MGSTPFSLTISPRQSGLYLSPAAAQRIPVCPFSSFNYQKRQSLPLPSLSSPLSFSLYIQVFLTLFGRSCSPSPWYDSFSLSPLLLSCSLQYLCLFIYMISFFLSSQFNFALLSYYFFPHLKSNLSSLSSFNLSCHFFLSLLHFPIYLFFSACFVFSAVTIWLNFETIKMLSNTMVWPKQTSNLSLGS